MKRAVATPSTGAKKPPAIATEPKRPAPPPAAAAQSSTSGAKGTPSRRPSTADRTGARSGVDDPTSIKTDAATLSATQMLEQLTKSLSLYTSREQRIPSSATSDEGTTPVTLKSGAVAKGVAISLPLPTSSTGKCAVSLAAATVQRAAGTLQIRGGGEDGDALIVASAHTSDTVVSSLSTAMLTKAMDATTGTAKWDNKSGEVVAINGAESSAAPSVTLRAAPDGTSVEVQAASGAKVRLTSISVVTPAASCIVSDATVGGGPTSQLPCGRGTLTIAGTGANATELTVEGAMRDGVPHGAAKMTASDRRWHFEGDWVRGAPQGRGVEVAAGKTVFSGEYVGGRRHGDGEAHDYLGHSGVTARGSWANGTLSGPVTLLAVPTPPPTAATGGAQKPAPFATVDLDAAASNTAVTLKVPIGEFRGVVVYPAKDALGSSWHQALRRAKMQAAGGADSPSPTATLSGSDLLAAAVTSLRAHAGLAIAAGRTHQHSVRLRTVAMLYAQAVRGHASAAATLRALEAISKDVTEYGLVRDEEKRHQARAAEFAARANAAHKAAAEKLAAATALEKKTAQLEQEATTSRENAKAEGGGDDGTGSAADSPTKTKSHTAAYEERLAMANKRLAAARLDLKSTKQMVLAVEKRVNGQRDVISTLEGQKSLTEEARLSAVTKLETAIADYDAKIAAEEAAVAERQRRLTALEAELVVGRGRMEGLAARLETSMGFGSASDAAAKLERVEADLARRRAELATAQTALDALRARRDTAAMRVADLHRAEREGDRELKASESAAADLREKLRKQRQRQDEEASRALEAEGRLQAMRSNRAAFNDDEDESAIRARHTRNVETFAARRDKANCELAALRHENEHLITQTQQLIAQRQAAQLQLRTSSLETVSPSPPASPTPLEVYGRSGPPTPLNSGNDSRIIALRKEIEKITAAMEQLTLEAKRLKDLRAAPAWMSLNVSACSLAQLKAMQAELRKAMGEGEGHVKQLRLDVAAAKAAADERKRETDSRRPAVPRDAKSDWQLKALQEALERRDTRLGDLKMQVARIKQLEAKLAVAGDTMIDLTAAAEVRHQQSVSKAKSDQAWASARNAATRRTPTNGLQSESSFGTSKSGSHF
jgi:hypothetical protein